MRRAELAGAERQIAARCRDPGRAAPLLVGRGERALGVAELVAVDQVEVITAFNAGTSNLVTVGYGAIAAGTADDFVPTVTEATPGVYPQATPGAPFAALAADTDVYVYYTPGAADATTGKARAFIEYARLAANG